MSIVRDSWFFEITKTALKDGVRLRNGDKPNQATFQNLVDSKISKAESTDRAKEDIGTFNQDIVGHVTLATDEQSKNNESKKPDRSLVVQPSQLPSAEADTLLDVGSGDLQYQGQMLSIEKDEITTRSNYVTKVVDGFSNWLNVITSTLSNAVSNIETLGQELNQTKVQVGQNTEAIDSLTSGTFQAVTPIGGTITYAGSAAPAGWVLLKGEVLLDKTTYASLYSLVGDVHNRFGDPADPNNFYVWREEYDGAASAFTPSNTANYWTTGENESYLSKSDLPHHTHDAGSYSTNTAGSHSHDWDVIAGGSTSYTQAGPSFSQKRITAPNNVDYKSAMVNDGDHFHSVNKGVSGNISSRGNQTKYSKVQKTIYENRIMYTGVI